MRPVNLIPAEERRGGSAPMRTGPLPYLVVAGLALVLAAVTAVVLFDNRVEGRKSDVAVLEASASATQARAQVLAPFASFQRIHDARLVTVDSLAESRFDWERVLRELTRVVPRHVWLTQIIGTVSPEVNADGEGSGLRDEVEGPALEITGCGRSQSDVARLVAAMEDIDGVTRVTAANSAKPANTTTTGSGGTCQTRSSIPQFHVIAAFDEIVPGASAPTAPDPVAPAPAAGDSTPAAASGDGSAAASGGGDTASGGPSAAQQGKIDTAAKIAGGG